MEIGKNLFKKIKNFIKNFFSKNEVKLLNSSNSNENINVNIKNNSFPKSEENEFDKIFAVNNISIERDEKREFFQLYNAVKTGKVSVYKLDLFDLIRISVMLKEEEKIKDNEKSLRNAQ